MVKIYRVGVEMREIGYVEVEAENEKEARDKAIDAVGEGDFVGYNSEGMIQEVLAVTEK